MSRKRSSIELDVMRRKDAMPSGGRDEAIYRNLYAAIVDNHLDPGTKLPEDTLAETFAVSRTSIRKVLQRLAHERLVDIRLNHGATVAQPSVKEARDVFAARRIIECGVIGQVLAKANAADVDALRQLVRAEHEAVARGDRRETICLSGEFHIALARVAGNETITELVTGLVARSSLVIATFGSRLSGSCRQSEHDDVLALLTAGDAEGARAWMERHLIDVERSVVLVDEELNAPDLRRVLEEVARRQRGAR